MHAHSPQHVILCFHMAFSFFISSDPFLTAQRVPSSLFLASHWVSEPHTCPVDPAHTSQIRATQSSGRSCKASREPLRAALLPGVQWCAHPTSSEASLQRNLQPLMPRRRKRRYNHLSTYREPLNFFWSSQGYQAPPTNLNTSWLNRLQWSTRPWPQKVTATLCPPALQQGR